MQRTNAEAPAARRFHLLAGLGLATLAWSAFLWRQLVAAREGADPFCVFGEPGSCGALWDGAFASAVHAWTGVPVAGWGMVWGLVAAVAAFLAARGGAGAFNWAGAVRWAGLGGLAGVVVLLGASLAGGAFCSSCAVIYLLCGVYGGIALWGLAGVTAGFALPALGRLAVVGLAGFLLLLPAGSRTPKSRAANEKAGLEAAKKAQGGVAGGGAGAATGGGLAASFTAGPGTGDAKRDQQLVTFLDGLQPDVRQLVSDMLAVYAEAPVHPMQTPRTVVGAPGAGVHLTEFTDTLCTHCATLHGSLEAIAGMVPAGTFSFDRRHYPLDGNCNPNLPVRGPESVRCVAARARVCLENHERSLEFDAALYRLQPSLTVEQVFEVAAPLMPRRELEVCMTSRETADKLRADVAYAAKYKPRGTPIVLVNGRLADSFAPFLYTVILTNGAANHPAFAKLPAPKPHAHPH